MVTESWLVGVSYHGLAWAVFRSFLYPGRSWEGVYRVNTQNCRAALKELWQEGRKKTWV